MTLVLTLLAAIVSFVIWYVKHTKYPKFHLGLLPIMLGAASIMWIIDGLFNLFGPERKFLGIEPYIVEDGKIVGAASASDLQAYFYQGMNDLALGFAVIVFAFLIWAIVLLISDPLSVWRKKITDKTTKE